MNATNRALNRVAILIVGLALLLVGAGAATSAAVPSWRDAWRDTAETLDPRFDPADAGTLATVLAACLVVVVPLVLFVLRQGRGHSRTIVRRDGSDGVVVVDATVAATLIESALAEHPAVASVSVSGYRVRRTPALKIAVSVRRGASPSELREAVDRVVERFDAVLGTEVPVLIAIG